MNDYRSLQFMYVIFRRKLSLGKKSFVEYIKLIQSLNYFQ